MSFDLPERSPLATLSIIDMSSSQVTCPRGHGGSWLLWPCLKHPPAQKSEDFRGRVGPRSVFCTEQPRVLQGSAQHQPGPFGLFKIQAPFLVKPCTLGTPPSPLGHCVTVEVSRVMSRAGSGQEGFLTLVWLVWGRGHSWAEVVAAGWEGGGSRLARLWLELATHSPPAPSPSLRAISLWQSQVLPGSPGDNRKGLLWILDEEVLIPGSGDGTAFERLCSYFATKAPDQEGKFGSAWLPTLWHCHLALEI